MTIKYLIEKEVRLLVRNPFIPKLIIAFPILAMCVLPWVVSMDVKNITVEVVDHDRSSESRQLIGSLMASEYFVFVGQKDTYEEALADIERMEADMVLEIPANFERDRLRGENPQLLIAANTVNATKGNLGTAYLTNIATAQAYPEMSRLMSKVSTLNLYNRELNYKLFMIPALMAIVMMIICGFLPALNIVSEKETGTIESVNVTPVSKLNFIISKLIPYWVIGLVAITLCLILAALIYGVTPAGSIWLVYLICIITILMFSGIGLVVSNYNDTMQQAILVMAFVIICLMMLSGFFTPVRSMPDWAYFTTYINPMHYFIDAIRSVFIRGTGFAGIAHQLAFLTASAVLINGWAVLSYSKRNKN